MGLSWKTKVLTALLGVATATGLTALVLFLVGATSVLLPADTKFGIVFDAGSSHTSLFVYKWPADKENNTGVVSQALACQADGPGISSYTSDPALAGESLRGCLEEALALIPEAQHAVTPTFLGATAGMRLLSQKNGSQAEGIFAEVARVLGQYPVDFQGATLLAGLDEGAFAWITINYVLGKLLTYTFSGEWVQPPEATLVGALDLGGASTQIAFVPGVPAVDASSQASFLLYGSSYDIYAQSHLCFGRDQVLTRLLARLVQDSPRGPVRHPCYHSGYLATQPLAPLFESPCVGTSTPPGAPGNVTVEGAGNPGACVLALRQLFNVSSCADCAFDRVHQPPVRGQFYAFSNFYYTFHFLNLTSGQSLDAANATVWEFCLRPWRLVELNYPGQALWLRDYCASGLYILTLLLEGYGFSEQTWANIAFRRQAGGTDVGWTLGYMLNLTNMIPAEAPARTQAEGHSIWLTSVIFVALTLGATLGAATVQLLRPRS